GPDQPGPGVPPGPPSGPPGGPPPGPPPGAPHPGPHPHGQGPPPGPDPYGHGRPPDPSPYGQGRPPGPPGDAPPGPPPPHGRSTGVIVAIVVAALIVIGGGVGLAVALLSGDDDGGDSTTSSSEAESAGSPQATAEAFAQAWSAGDCEALSAVMTDRLQTAEPCSPEALDGEATKPPEITEESEDSATAEFDVEGDDGFMASYVLTLVNENGEWLVDDYVVEAAMG